MPTGLDITVNSSLFDLFDFCPGVSEDRRDLTVEAATEGLPGGHQPQAK